MQHILRWKRGKKIARKLVKKYPRKFPQVDVDKIAFVIMEGNDKARWLARIRKIQDEYLPLLNDDNLLFIMIFNYDYARDKTDDLKSAYKKLRCLAIFHELHHISSDGRRLRGHNVEDFKDVLKVGSMSYWMDDLESLPDLLSGERKRVER